MVDEIGELAAKSGNEKVYKWAIRNDFYIEENFQEDLFQDVTEVGHLKVLEKISTFKEALLVATAEKCWRMLWPEQS
jgi:hypothetical protein